MDTLGKFSSSVSKKLQGKKTSSNNSSGGQGLRETVKEATAKTLRRPDPDLNQQVGADHIAIPGCKGGLYT